MKVVWSEMWLRKKWEVVSYIPIIRFGGKNFQSKGRFLLEAEEWKIYASPEV